MIVKEQTNTTPYNITQGDCYKILGKSKKGVETTMSLDFCLPCCKYTEKVFGSDNSNYWENDIRTFFFAKALDDDSVDFYLYKDGEELALLDGSLGTLNTSGDNIYYYLNFSSVLSLYGSGTYSVVYKGVYYGESFERESHSYLLMPYDIRLANGTVLIESYQNGYIISEDVDYTGLNLYQAIRVKADKMLIDSKIETDNYMDEDYQLKQIRDKIVNEYTLRIFPIPKELSDKILYNYILGDSILLTDYNLYKNNNISRLDVRIKDITEKKQYHYSDKDIILLKFTDKKDNIIKTH